MLKPFLTGNELIIHVLFITNRNDYLIKEVCYMNQYNRMDILNQAFVLLESHY